MRTLVTSLFVVVLLGTLASTAGAQTRARAALSRTLPDVRLDNVTLADAFDFIRDISGVNLSVNWRALEGAGIDRTTPVNIRLRAVTLRKVLNIICNDAGQGLITYYISENVLTITTRELADKDMITKIYPVEDLIMDVPDFVDAPEFNLQGGGGGGGGGGSGGGGGGGGGGLFGGGGGAGGGGGGGGNEQRPTREQRAQELIDLITSIIEPDKWTVNGGNANIRFFNGSLVVTAPRSIHEALGGATD